MTGSNSNLINFYLGNTVDHRGRKIEDIWQWNDHKLESVHDYIQWLFPLKEKSGFNASAPILTEEDILKFRSTQPLGARLLISFDLLLKFYGYQRRDHQIIKSKNHDLRITKWLKPYNHNFLRITRILKSLTLLGFSTDSKQFFTCLEELYLENSEVIGARSFDFWQRSIVP